MSTDKPDTQETRGPGHARKDGDPIHPLIDLSRDPNPGRADHGLPGHDDDDDLSAEAADA